MNLTEPMLQLCLVEEPRDTGAVSCADVPSETAGEAEPWTDPATREHGYCLEEGDGYRLRIYGVGSFAFSRTSGIVRGVREPGVAPELFEDVFHRQLLPFVLQRQSWEVLHASGLRGPGGCVALCGDSQMGKSTLAHVWHQRGGQVFADDAVPFRVEGDGVWLRPLPFRLRLRPQTRHYFGPAQPGTATSLPGGMRNRDILSAIYLLHRGCEEEEPIHLRPVCPEAALPALLKQAFCLTLQDRARNRQMVETYLALISRVPVFRLAYPTGLDHVQPVLDQLAAHMASMNGDAVFPTGPEV